MLYAWTDLETTGAGDNDHIIEVGIVFTNSKLELIDTYEAVCGMNGLTYSYRAHCDPVVREMHDHNGLWDAAEASNLTIGDIDMAVSRLVDNLTAELAEDDAPHPAVLAGSGVGHFDRRFIRKQMHRFEERLRYWNIDVGVVRRFMRDVAHREDLIMEQPTKPHRALQDAFLHLDEARYYAKLLGTIHAD